MRIKGKWNYIIPLIAIFLGVALNFILGWNLGLRELGFFFMLIFLATAAGMDYYDHKFGGNYSPKILKEKKRIWKDDDKDKVLSNQVGKHQIPKSHIEFIEVYADGLKFSNLYFDWGKIRGLKVSKNELLEFNAPECKVYDLNVILKNGERETALLFDIKGFGSSLKKCSEYVPLDAE